MVDFYIKEYYFGARAKIYALYLKDEEISEFDKFLIKKNVEESGYKEFIIDKILDIANHAGAREIFFKPQGKINDSVYRLKETGKYIRLYCCRYGQIILILGGGGYKKTRTYQETKELYDQVKLLQQMDQKIVERMKSKEIIINENNELEGNLKFYEEE